MIFVDSGAWVALSLPDDRNHPSARRVYTALAGGSHGAMMTSSFVLDETVTFLRMAADMPTASRLARTVLASRQVTVASIDPATFDAALRLFEARPDRRWSLTDCTSFVIMDELGIRDAFAFDHNFDEAGFTRRP